MGRGGRPYMAEMTWEEVADFLREHDVVVVPVGSCEQHGPHRLIRIPTMHCGYRLGLLKKLAVP